jgi:hypothetical protein
LLRELREADEDVVNLSDRLVRDADDRDSIIRVSLIDARDPRVGAKLHSNGEAGCVIFRAIDS